jgi:hypothetical protein
MSYVAPVFIRNSIHGLLTARQLYHVPGPRRDVVLKVVRGASNAWYVEIRAGAVKLYTSDLGTEVMATEHAKKCYPHLAAISMCREASVEDQVTAVLLQSL